MPILLFLLMLNGTQPIAGPVTDCPVVVEVVDPAWALMPGVDVTVRDERTQRTTRSTITIARSLRGNLSIATSSASTSQSPVNSSEVTVG